MRTYKQAERPELLKIRADMIKTVGFAILLAGLTPAVAGIVGDFGSKDPMSVFWFVIGAIACGALFLRLSYYYYLQADIVLFNGEEQNSN